MTAPSLPFLRFKVVVMELLVRIPEVLQLILEVEILQLATMQQVVPIRADTPLAVTEVRM